MSKAVGHASTKVTDSYIHHSTNSRNKLKRKHPVDMMDIKLKKIKREDLKFECFVKNCKYKKGKLKGT